MEEDRPRGLTAGFLGHPLPSQRAPAWSGMFLGSVAAVWCREQHTRSVDQQNQLIPRIMHEGWWSTISPARLRGGSRRWPWRLSDKLSDLLSALSVCWMVQSERDADIG